MWVAVKPFSYRGKRYAAGEQVPAEGWSIRKALVTLRKIRFVSLEDPTPEVPTTPELVVTESVNLKSLRRSELNTYAESIGLENPTGYANAELLIAAIEEFQAKDESEDETEDESEDKEEGEDEENV